MTATTYQRSAAPRIHAGSAAAMPYGRAPYALSVGLVLVTLAAVGGALFLPDIIRGPAVSVGNLQGTALVLGVVTLPVLVVAMVLVARGMPVAIVFWLGALGSAAYQSVLFLFAVPFNSLFFFYVAMLSLSVWSIVIVTARIPIDRVSGRIGGRAPVRLVAAYLLINAFLFGVLWLRSTVPPVVTGEAPTFLDGTGMLTGPVQILDFAFTLPLMTLGAVLLLRSRPWGYLLSGALLVMLAIETASIGVDQWMGHAADPASPASSAELTPVFAVLTVIGVVVLGLFMRRGPRTEPAEPGQKRLR